LTGLEALDDDYVVDYQITAGLSVKINDRWDLRSDFRLLETTIRN
jgi:hypothetical protein